MPLTPDEWAERTERLRRAEERVKAGQPTECPTCGDERVAPTFRMADEWDCPKGHVWREQG